jgi:hypothetical protein
MRLHEAIEQAEDGDHIKRAQWKFKLRIDYAEIADEDFIGMLRKENESDYIPSTTEICARDWQIIKKKQDPVTAEEWLDTKGKFIISHETMPQYGMRAYNDGVVNTHLLYAELMEVIEAKDCVHCPLSRTKMHEIVDKIKEHNAKI